jgi:hypothetical protein
MFSRKLTLILLLTLGARWHSSVLPNMECFQ